MTYLNWRVVAGLILIAAGLAPASAEVTVHQGFPSAGNLTAYDLDGDGIEEILQLSQSGSLGVEDSYAHAYHVADGVPQYLDNWPVPIAGNIAYLPPGVGEVIAENPGPEVVVACSLHPYVLHVYIFDSAGNTLVHRSFEDVVEPRALVVADVNADGLDEIVIGGWDPIGGDTVLLALDGQAGPLSDVWPKAIESLQASQIVVDVTLAVGDIAPKMPGLETVYMAHITTPGGAVLPSAIFVFDHTGQPAPGWESGVSLPDGEGGFTRPALADLDQDGHLEIMCVTKRTPTYLHAYRYNGEEYAPREYTGPWGNSPVVGDLDQDGDLEIVVSDRYWKTVRAFDHNMQQLFASPDGGGNIALADVNNDGLIEIISAVRGPDGADGESFIHATSPFGFEINGWPITVPESISIAPEQHTPTIANLDADPDMEIRIGNALLDIPTPYSSCRVPWATYQRDARHTGEQPGGAVFGILSSVPVTGAIDGRQPFAMTAPDVAQGWDRVTLILDGDARGLEPQHLAVTSTAGIAPAVSHVVASTETAEVVFEHPIPTGAWTTVTHTCSGDTVRLGYLPGDVDGNRTVLPSDIFALIQALNGQLPTPDFRSDTNRSGSVEPRDILRLIDLLNGAGEYQSWSGATLPPP